MKCRRSVKRVSRENLDDHKQNAKYAIQHSVRDQCSQDEIAFVERDDRAKMRMNSGASTSQHATLTDERGAATTRHDYMDNEVASSLYATSYRATKMRDGREVDLAVVKADRFAKSTPAQHMADLYMLERSSDADTRQMLLKPDGNVKPVIQFEGALARATRAHVPSRPVTSRPVTVLTLL